MSSLFSKSALESISTPEQLDQQTKIVKPFYWLGIVAFSMFVVAVVIWAIFGYIHSTIDLQGIIFPKAGVSQVSAGTKGTVKDVLYKIGEEVKKGDIIAIVPDEELYAEIEATKEKMDQADSKDEKEIVKEKLNELYAAYEHNSVIRATEDGTIQNIISVGDILSPGEQVANVQVNSQYSNNRQVVAYVPLKVAKRLKTGMEVQLCPSHISWEEYGYMEGYITSIGEVPVTEDSLKKYYGNLEYVRDILPGESCVEVLIGIQVDEESENLFQWSSEKGKHVVVEIGTVCNIRAVVDSRHPISLLY